jgi:hypothetical protein
MGALAGETIYPQDRSSVEWLQVNRLIRTGILLFVIVARQEDLEGILKNEV